MKKIILVLLLLSAGPARAEYSLFVVTNPARKVTHLSKEEVKDLFLRNRRKIDDWTVKPLDQDGSSQPYSDFQNLVFAKSPVEMKSFWAEKIFSGNGRPPETVSNDQAVVQRVLNDPDAIGYVSPSADVSKLTVVLRLP